MPRLSAVLIVRDESAFLGNCLEALREVAQELVVLDTGSEDNTVEIAHAAGAVVGHRPWDHDFAAARNAALELATGDWVLYVDADERVAVHGELNGILEDEELVAATVRFHAKRGLTAYAEPRLFRRRPEIRFRGVIHETIRYDLERAVEAGARVGVAPMTIQHLGYEGDRRRKFERDLPLLERAVLDQPTRIYLWHALGEARRGLGRDLEARAAWENGLDQVRSEAPRALHVLIYADLISLALDTGSPCLDLVDEASARHPDDPLITWLRARRLATIGEGTAARAILARLATLGPGDPDCARIAYDEGLFTHLAWALAGTTWLADGKPARAAQELQRALDAIDPDEPPPGATNLRAELEAKLALARAQHRAQDSSCP